MLEKICVEEEEEEEEFLRKWAGEKMGGGETGGVRGNWREIDKVFRVFVLREIEGSDNDMKIRGFDELMEIFFPEKLEKNFFKKIRIIGKKFFFEN